MVTSLDVCDRGDSCSIWIIGLILCALTPNSAFRLEGNWLNSELLKALKKIS